MSKETKVGKYYVMNKKIGNGAFGEIYEGQHTQTKDFVAIKLESAMHPVP